MKSRQRFAWIAFGLVALAVLAVGCAGDDDDSSGSDGDDDDDSSGDDDDYGDDDDSAPSLIAAAVGYRAGGDEGTVPLIAARYPSNTSWFEIYPDASWSAPSQLADIAFDDDGVAWAVGWSGPDGSRVPLLVRFDDDELSFESLSTDDGDAWLSAVTFDAGDGVLVGNTAVGDASFLYERSDLDWERDDAFPGDGFTAYDVAACPTGVLLTAGFTESGESGAIAERDAGGDWAFADLPGPTAPWSIQAVSCFAGGAVAVGSTNDGGADVFLRYDGDQWTDESTLYPGFTDGTSMAVDFVDVDTGWIFSIATDEIGEAVFVCGGIWSTADPYLWQYEAQVYGLTFAPGSDLAGVAVGRYPSASRIQAFILTTDDPCGDNWTLEDEPILVAPESGLFGAAVR